MKETREEIILKYINEFESGAIKLKSALRKINEIATTEIDTYSLENYWRSESLEDFVKTISIELVKNPQSITDDQALKLIQEILDNIIENALIHRNSIALETRFSKPSGTVVNYIFQEDITDSHEILVKLKTDSVIHA
ncbi:MAG: hypothetical protein HRU38_24675 [Saccharospirillaceae bacterium]|nr:hypothetical protein [Saccharospirillaceae bacterium]